MKHFEYTAVVWKEEEGYVSKCSELGVASCGETVEGAVSNLKEAVELYLENAKELGIIEVCHSEFISESNDFNNLAT
jgi:predicted RNase H-like HicB family nuclease